MNLNVLIYLALYINSLFWCIQLKQIQFVCRDFVAYVPLLGANKTSRGKMAFTIPYAWVDLATKCVSDGEYVISLISYYISINTCGENPQRVCFVKKTQIHICIEHRVYDIYA